MGLVDKMKSGRNAIERTLSGLPGIGEYKEKELRRAADRRVRDALAQLLEDQRSRLTGLQLDLLGSGGLDWMDDLERAIGRLQLLIDRVKSAAYGYAGFFDAEKVREEQLEALARFDQEMIRRVGELQEKVNAVEQAIADKENIGQTVHDLADFLAELNRQWRHRREAMRNTVEE
ncbi:MAG: hypothetical protein J7M34_09620 [Anaerolineae bacterium]|nr:hypothetical protein [Anaerolineae bacterium]